MAIARRAATGGSGPPPGMVRHLPDLRARGGQAARSGNKRNQRRARFPSYSRTAARLSRARPKRSPGRDCVLRQALPRDQVLPVPRDHRLKRAPVLAQFVDGDPAHVQGPCTTVAMMGRVSCSSRVSVIARPIRAGSTGDPPAGPAACSAGTARQNRRRSRGFLPTKSLLFHRPY